MLSESFHWVSWAAQTQNSLWHQLFRQGGWLEDVTDVCRKEWARKWRKMVIEAGRGGHASIPSSPPPPQPRLNSVLLVARMGRDQLAAACQVKLRNQTIKLRHVLSLNTITWRLRMDNPLKPDQRKSEFWSGLQCVRVYRRSWYRQLFTWLQHVIQLENTLHLFMKELCRLFAWKTAECTVIQGQNDIILCKHAWWVKGFYSNICVPSLFASSHDWSQIHFSVSHSVGVMHWGNV